MKKTNKILLVIILVLASIVTFYYYLGIKWGEGMSEVAKEYVKVKQDLLDTIPTSNDSIYNNIKLKLDSITE